MNKFDLHRLIALNDELIENKGTDKTPALKSKIGPHGAPVFESRYHMLPFNRSRINRPRINRAAQLQQSISESLNRITHLRNKLNVLESRAVSPLDSLSEIIERKRNRVGVGAHIRENANNQTVAPSNYISPAERYGKPKVVTKPVARQESVREDNKPPSWEEIENKILAEDKGPKQDEMLSRVSTPSEEIIQESVVKTRRERKKERKKDGHSIAGGDSSESDNSEGRD
jgi:hypothetical protein